MDTVEDVDFIHFDEGLNYTVQNSPKSHAPLQRL